jgi:DNA-binding PadR family transcriptional regulator
MPDLTPFSYEILVALAGGDLHGYGILKDIEERNGEGAVPSTGALYLALQRIEEAGLIVESKRQSADARRRYYRLTAAGRETARRETTRLAGLVGVARDRELITPAALSRALPGSG